MTTHAAAEQALTRELLRLDNQVCFAIYAASRRVVRAYRPLLEDLGLTYPQYLVLLVLWGWDHEPTDDTSVRALGERLELDSGTLTPLLRRLEEKNLIARHRSATDERELTLSLTRAGRVLKRRARKIPLSLLSDSPLPHDELFRLRDQLKRLRPPAP